MPKTITLITGLMLTLRDMTEAEAIAYADKRMASARPGEHLVDKLDDGDDEVIACIQEPTKAEVLDLLEDYPALTKSLGRELARMGGDGLDLIEVPVLATDAISPIADAQPPKLGRFLKVEVLEGPARPQDAVAPTKHLTILLRKLSRMEHKFLTQEPDAKRRGRVSYASLAKAAKGHVISGADESTWARFPFLSHNLGALLFTKSNVDFREDEGK